VASRAAHGAAWQGAWRPPKAVLKAAESHARCVEVARRHGESIPRAAELAGRENIGGGGAAPWREREAP